VRKMSNNNNTPVPISSRIFYCYQNEIGVEKEKQKAFDGYQGPMKMSYTLGTRDFVCSLQKKMEEKNAKPRKYKCQKFMDKSCANNVDNELRIADLNNEATTAKHDNVDGSVLVFDRGKVAGLRVKEDEHQSLARYQKSAKMSCVEGVNDLVSSYQNGTKIEKHEPNVFHHYQKPASTNYTSATYALKNENKVDHINAIYKIGHCYKDGIEIKKGKYHAPFLGDQKEFKAHVTRERNLPPQFHEKKKVLRIAQNIR